METKNLKLVVEQVTTERTYNFTTDSVEQSNEFLKSLLNENPWIIKDLSIEVGNSKDFVYNSMVFELIFDDSTSHHNKGVSIQILNSKNINESYIRCPKFQNIVSECFATHRYEYRDVELKIIIQYTIRTYESKNYEY